MQTVLEEITEERYHLGVPGRPDRRPRRKQCGMCTDHDAITAFFMPRTKGDRPDVIPDGCVNFAFLGQFADTRDTVFTTQNTCQNRYGSCLRTLGVDRGRTEAAARGSVFTISVNPCSSVKLMGRQTSLEIDILGASFILKPVLHFIKGTVIEKVLRDYDVLKDGM